jgi:N-acetylmuramic acid 6-phosphate (MurNAc-6-P) etherase
MDDSVNAIAVSGSTVYAGGAFTFAGTCTSGCSHIAKYGLTYLVYLPSIVH